MPYSFHEFSRKKTLERAAEAQLPTEFGDFRLIGYRSLHSDEEFVVIARGRSRRPINT